MIKLIILIFHTALRFLFIYTGEALAWFLGKQQPRFNLWDILSLLSFIILIFIFFKTFFWYELVTMIISGIITSSIIDFYRDGFKLSENKYIRYIQMFIIFIIFIMLFIISLIFIHYIWKNITSPYNLEYFTKKVALIISQSAIYFKAQNYLIDIFWSYQEWLLSLSTVEHIAALNILGCLIIFFSIISIYTILFSNFLIDYLKIIDRYPILKKFLDLRLKFQRFYLLTNLTYIIVILCGMLYINTFLF